MIGKNLLERLAMNIWLNCIGFEKYLKLAETRSNGTNGVTYKFIFPNGYGASVVKWIGDEVWDASIGGYDDKWELAVISKYAETDSRWPVFEYGENNYYIDYETPITNDVIGYLTDEEVRNILDRIYKLPKR